MKLNKCLNFLPVICFLFLSAKSVAQNNGVAENTLFARKYKPGETYRYKLTMQESHNGVWALTNVAVCELKVVTDSAGIPYDEVHWLSKKVFTPKDTTDETAKAVSVKPYRISLSSKGRLDLPAIEVTEMTECIQDFNTFFVAVSPLLGGIDQLKKEGDTMQVKKPVIANFANGTNMLKGEDCLAISAKLVSDTKDEVVLRTDFMPPKESGLTYINNDVAVPVIKDTMNNFQMVTPAGNNLYNVNYGREFFFITSTLQKSDGKILSAQMFNKLNLKIKINCDKDYKNCQFEVPFAEQRVLTLELLK